jgi:hypothetical protein
MSNGIVLTSSGKKASIHRIFDASPSYTAPTKFKVGTGTNTPNVTDVDLQTAITIGGLNSKSVVTGYPIYDDTNLIVTNRCLVLTTECNGSNVTEFGLVNTDASPVLFSHSVFTAIAKTTSVQIIFKEIDKLI